MVAGVASSNESKTWILPAFSATKTLPSELNLTAVGTFSPDSSVTTSNPLWTGSPRVSTGAAAAAGDVEEEDEGSPMSPSPGPAAGGPGEERNSDKRDDRPHHDAISQHSPQL